MNTIAVWILAYFLGSIPFGLILAKIRNVDIRQHGSGNIGATNVARTLGKKAGLLTLAGDCGKGYLACWIAGRVLEAPEGAAVAGLIAFLGHVFPVFLKFKGGKGVATGLGIYLYLMPWAGLIALGVFMLNLVITRYVSVSSITAAVAVPILGMIFHYPDPSVYVAVVAGVVTLAKHRANISRLLKGTESKFMQK